MIIKPNWTSVSRGVLKNILWLLLDRVGRMIIGLLVTAWVARYLGPDQYGLLAYAVAFGTILQAVASTGTDNLIISKIVQNKEKANLYLGFSFLSKIIISAVIAGGSVFFILFFEVGGREQSIICAIIFMSVIFTPAESVDLWFNSQTKSQYSARAKIFSYIISAIVRILLLVGQFPVIYFAIANLIEAGLSAIFLFFAYRRSSSKNTVFFSKIIAVEIIQEGWPYFLSTLAVVCYMRMDQVILGAMLSKSELGIYAAIVPFSAAWAFLPVAVVSSVLPSFSSAYLSDKSLFNKKLQFFMSKMFWMGLFLSGIISIFSKTILENLLGHVYSAYYPVLAIHAFSNVFVFLGVAQTPWVVVTRNGGLLLKRSLTGVLISIGMNLILIPYVGIIGAAIASLVAQMFSTILVNCLIAPPIFKMQIKSIFINPVAAFRG